MPLRGGVLGCKNRNAGDYSFLKGRLTLNDEKPEKMPLEISLFGASEVRIDGCQVTFAPKKTKWMLMLLVLASTEGRSRSRLEISMALWPGGDQGEYTVNRHMPAMKRALGLHAVRILEPEPHTLRFDLKDVVLDLERYREMLKQALLVGDPAPIAAAPDMRPGRLMLDFPEGQITIEGERVKLRQEFAATLDSIADLASTKGDWHTVTKSLSMLLADNPLPDEASTRRLMQAYIALGLPAETRAALIGYQEKGGRPSAELIELSRQGRVTSGSSNSDSLRLMESSPAYDVNGGDSLRKEAAVIINQSKSISKLRKFLTQNPHLLVGSDHVLGSAVISDWRLGPDLQVDFGYIEPISGRSYLHLISFVDPTARIFTDRDEFTDQFNRACELLTSCAYWIGRKQLLLPEIYGPQYEEIAGVSLDPGFFLPKCTLIVGRRTELTSTRRRDKLDARRGIDGGSLEIRTYDGFLELTEPTIRTDPSNLRGIKCHAGRTV